MNNYDDIVKDLKNIFGNDCWTREDNGFQKECHNCNDYYECDNLCITKGKKIKEEWFNKLGDNIICIINCDNESEDLDYYNHYSGSKRVRKLEAKYSINHEWETEWLAYIYYDDIYE